MNVASALVRSALTCALLASAAVSAHADSLFDPATVPVLPAADDPGAVELGVRFVPGRDGVITGIRFYRAVQNDGIFSVSLWDENGNRIGSGGVSEGLPAKLPGWVQLPLTAPVAVTAGKTYTASYYHRRGGYAFSAEAFARPVYRQQLFAGVAAGVYLYSNNGGGFPTNTYRNASYLVDVVYQPGADPTGDAGIRPPNSLSPDAVDPGSFNLSFGPGSIGSGEVFIPPARHYFEVDGQFAGVVPFAVGVGPARLPVLALGGTHTVRVRGQASDGRYSAWSPVANVTLPAPRDLTQGPFSLVYPHANPRFELGDATPVEIGLGFVAASDGFITGVRFYKGSQSAGPFIGSLWRADGTLLAQTTAQSSTGFGWRELTFATPEAIVAGEEYVVSYWAPNGFPGYSPGFFRGGPVDFFPLRSTTAALRRVGSRGFPTQPDSDAANLFVDVIFSAKD
jgi:Domain of unknown function (DUF4082)